MAGDYRTPDRPNRDRIQSNSRKVPPSGRPSSPARPAITPGPNSSTSSEQGHHPINNPPSQSVVASQFNPSSDQAVVPPSPLAPNPRRLGRFRLPRSWQFWGITLMVAFSGLGILSATALLRLPSLPNCPAIFWPTASASLRIYCAQLAAEKRTVKDLLRAISLVNALPKDHPLRPEIDRNIEDWAKEILELGEEAFQDGDLDKAIEAAKKIPENTSAHALVEDKIIHWESVWKKAEDIYRQAEEALKNQELRQAFRIATQLLGIGNQYWENTKYRELNNLIVETRQDSSKIDKAKGLADQGSLTNLLEAIKLVESIQPKSYLYTKAQDLIAQFGRDMLNLAEAALDRRDYNEALKITRQIPDKANLQEEIRDFDVIAEAQSQAWGGTIADLEAAIINVQRIKRDRPLYGRAQQLVSTWQLEIQDVTVLERAKQMAQPGTVGDLSAAIAEAQRIPFGNPRREEAEKEINQWQAQIETSEDQPYLNRATQFASTGDLQAAINEASRIRPGRSLYDQASRRIDEWTAEMQRLQDQPLLDRARQLASSGDLEAAIDVARQIGYGRDLYNEAQTEVNNWSAQLQQLQDQPYLDQARQLASQGNIGEAIAVAERIGSGRALYDEAQTEIQQWRSQFQGQDYLRQAYNAANIGSPAMLVAAIEIASQVPENNPARSEADRMIQQWSFQILQIAQSQAGANPREAIAIAEQIPENTAAYAEAQQNIQAWRQFQGRR
ncbi:MAG: chromosome segregation ATPase [Elainella sp. C42_A2020_010]|nr:chromosome segregation ATPase [Elainella sp. C42_A2020_010]